MLISTSHGVPDSNVVFEKSKVVSFHSEVVDDLLRLNYEDRKDPNNGWSKERNFRHVARLSPLAYLSAVKKYPEVEGTDKIEQNKGWRKVLADPEFALYRVVSRGL